VGWLGLLREEGHGVKDGEQGVGMEAELLLEGGDALWGGQQGSEPGVAPCKAPQQAQEHAGEPCRWPKISGLMHFNACKFPPCCPKGS